MKFEDYITNLPNEVLEHIITYADVETRSNIALVCSKFYENLCTVERDKFPLVLSGFQLLEDDDIYESVISSSRQFQELTLDLKHCGIVHDSTRFEEVVMKFGRRIEKFKLWVSSQKEASEISDYQLIRILRALPNVVNITIRNVCINTSVFLLKANEELNLHKLRSLTLDYCMIEQPKVLEMIPENVLRELVFTFETLDETKFQNFFDRQSLIQKLEIFENDKISFEHLALRHLKISSSTDFPSIIRQQPKLQYIDFPITWMENDAFTEICKLKHLEVLKMLIDQISCHEFKTLCQLPRLKELRLETHNSFDTGHFLELSMMQQELLEKLTLLCTERKITDEVIIQISKNFPRLQSIELMSRSIKTISTTLENFPQLDSLLLDFFSLRLSPDDILVINDDLKHEKLKQLVVTNMNVNELENSKPLLKLIGVCPNLERIMLSQLKGLNHEEFKQIFENHKKLTHLSLEFNELEFTCNAIELVQNCSTLKHIRLNGLSVFPAYSKLKILFQNQFPNITLYKFSTGNGELIMKKRNIKDWYSSFNLISHF